jgi:hypothetical protein
LIAIEALHQYREAIRLLCVRMLDRLDVDEFNGSSDVNSLNDVIECELID